MTQPLRILLLFSCMLMENFVQAQSFVNGDLDGIVDFVSTPTGWSQIPFGDPAIQAGPMAAQATSDLADVNGPSPMQGIAGVPQSGTTFSCALHASIVTPSQTTTWHEGIMQDVSGFAIGATYEISLYQTIVKQTNCIDESGSWRIYIDNTLIATTVPTISSIAFDDLNLEWENRIVAFTATATSHTIKFVPWDDDLDIETSYTNSSGALRMGIDNISFILPNQNPPAVNLGVDTTLCVGTSLVLDATYPNSTYLWQDGSTNPTFTVDQAGVYWVDVTNPFGTTRDSIVVDYESPPTAFLNDQTFGCPIEAIKLIAESSPGSTLMWQDGSTGAQYTITETGIYTVTATNLCGSSSATSVVDAEDCGFILEMPNVFTPNGDNTNDSFIPIQIDGVQEQELVVLNRWGNVIYTSTETPPSWDGLSEGIECIDGVYFWKIEAFDFNGKRYSFHGIVHLIR